MTFFISLVRGSKN